MSGTALVAAGGPVGQLIAIPLHFQAALLASSSLLHCIFNAEQSSLVVHRTALQWIELHLWQLGSMALLAELLLILISKRH